MLITFMFVITVSLLNASPISSYNIVPKFDGQDSAIIVDTDQAPPVPPKLPIVKPQMATFPYYQPIHNIPAYKTFLKTKAQDTALPLKNAGQHMPKAASPAIYTQEQFPRDLLEIAQQRLGLKSLDEVPTITELAELLGTNSAAETISYIRQLTSTESGIALIKAYIESQNNTDSIRSKSNDINATVTEASTSIDSTTTLSSQSHESNLSATNNEVALKHKETLEKEILLKKPQTTKAPYINLRPFFARNPLPYHYPTPLRPVLANRINYAMQMYKQSVAAANLKSQNSTDSPLTKALKRSVYSRDILEHIQRLALVANVPLETVDSFLYRKPKLGELADKVARFPLTRDSNYNLQLLAVVHKVIKDDEDLRKLLNSTDTLK